MSCKMGPLLDYHILYIFKENKEYTSLMIIIYTFKKW